MKNEQNHHVCPIELAGSLDNRFRKWFQNPLKILRPYVKEGITTLDLGCGPGFFTIALAALSGDSGKVIAADLQEGMLEKVRQKITGTVLEQRIVLHKCYEDTLAINIQVDFILAFYMVHEVPNPENLFRELKSILKPGGQLLIVEPKFHVSRRSFTNMIETLNRCGFKIIKMPKVSLSRAILLAN